MKYPTLLTTSYRLLCTAILSLLAVSCIKEDLLPVMKIDEELLARFTFKPGSYWVYYDSAARIWDSVTMEQRLDRTYTNHHKDIMAQQQHVDIQLICHSNYYYHDSMEWWVRLAAPNYSKFTLSIYYNYRYEYDYFMYRSDTSWMAEVMDVAFYRNKGDSVYFTAKYHPELLLGGVLWRDVYETRYTQRDKQWADVYYMTKEAGFVAVLLGKPGINRAMYLQRWHLVQ